MDQQDLSGTETGRVLANIAFVMYVMIFQDGGGMNLNTVFDLINRKIPVTIAITLTPGIGSGVPPALGTIAALDTTRPVSTRSWKILPEVGKKIQLEQNQDDRRTVRKGEVQGSPPCAWNARIRFPEVITYIGALQSARRACTRL